ncbi:MAG: hypothetical protein ACRDQ6_17015, partial [Pseudonocardiaceae bacterium]
PRHQRTSYPKATSRGSRSPEAHRSAGRVGTLKIRKHLAMMSGIAISLAAAGAVLIPASPAFAAQTQAHVDTAFYVTTTDASTIETDACNAAANDAPGAARLTVLDFGAQYSDGSGTKPAPNGLSGEPTKLTIAQIETLAEDYALYWWGCTNDTSTLDLALGTNNSTASGGIGWVSTAGGQAWANVVNDVQNWVQNNVGQVIVDGANDFEPAFGPSSSATDAENWANGYSNAGTSTNYYDFGSADGCSKTAHSNTYCTNGWYQYNAWYVSWGASAAYPLPEIYYASNAQQWTQVSYFGATGEGGRIDIQGPMTDQNDLNPTVAWNDLWNGLNTPGYPTAQNLTYEDKIYYETAA